MLETPVLVALVLLVAVAVFIGVAVRRAGRAELPPPERKRPLRERRVPELEAPEEAEEAEAEAEEEVEEEEKPRDVERERRAALKAGLQKTRGGFIAKLGALFSGKKTIDPAMLERLEAVLLGADI